MKRFLPFFLLLIGNVKTRKQNLFTQCPETIFQSHLAGFECLEAVFVKQWSLCLVLPFPEWFDPGISFDDLPDSFTGCLIQPEDKRACIVAV